MKITQIEALMAHSMTNKLKFAGTCADCKCRVGIMIDLLDNGELSITGGAICDTKGNLDKADFKLKCDPCYTKDPTFGGKTEVWSRCVGYLRPVSQWNKGKQEEFKERKPFKINEVVE